ncbi:type 1 glutamine amidotransferase [Cyanobacteria bacterium FACHB-471]|nr:type 1 glutamine amidotransferase [Cyanobacteria bacterium FACHB-471]
MSKQLQGVKVAVLATMGVEQIELTAPRQALDEAGATTHLVSPQAGTIKALQFPDWGDEFSVDVLLNESDPAQYQALYLPGGIINPDLLRINSDAVRFVKASFEVGKPVATMCHGLWMLIEADVVEGRTVTSWLSLRKDLINAGANWIDQAVVIDNDLITARNPGDIPEFAPKVVELFASKVIGVTV